MDSTPFVKVSIADADRRPVADIVFRKGSADEKTLREVMGQRAYDISHLRRRGELIDFHKRTLAEGRKPLIVDLGANIGASALYFDHVWPGSDIVAIEPEPDNFQLLVENTKTRQNIHAIHAGIAASDGSMTIEDRNADTDAFRTRVGHGPIRAISMASLLREQSGVPFICKIDIEGAERDLFSGDTSWIDLFPLILIELHDWMLPGEAVSQPFLQAISQRRRDFTFRRDTVFSIRC